MSQTLPKTKMTENLTLSAANFRSYIKVGVILGQSMAEILSELWSGKSSFFDSRGKVKSNKRCNEELVAPVKALADEDARISL